MKGQLAGCPLSFLRLRHSAHRPRHSLAEWAYVKGVQPYCRDCQSKKAKEHYAANRTYYLAKAVRQREKLKAFIREAKSKPSCDCRVLYPFYVMEFDHREGKEFNIGGSYSFMGMEAILREIAKCDVVCANCHRERSYQRRLTGGLEEP